MSVLNYKKPAFRIICISVIACIIVAVCFLTNPKEDNETYVENDTIEDAESTGGEDIWDYPIKDWETAQSSNLDFMGWKDACNPPEDILNNLSTETLAGLSVRYPLFPYMPSGATDSEASIFIGTYEGYSSIFRELMKREDRNICLLKEFAKNEPDIEVYNSGAYIENESIWIENFIQQYLFVYSKDLTSEEREYYLDAVKTKTAKFYSKIDEGLAGFGLSFDESGRAYR